MGESTLASAGEVLSKKVFTASIVDARLSPVSVWRVVKCLPIPFGITRVEPGRLV